LKTNNTNFNDVLVILLSLTYMLLLFAGTAYLVQYCGWSKWTFLFAMFLVPRIKTGYGKVAESETK
jgi:hypothetical protein